MKDWTTSFLIAFGFVIGAICALVAAPYLLTIELVQGNPKLGGLPNEYGGIFGGLMALGAAVLVVWMEHRKSAKTDLEFKQVLAYNLLVPLMNLHGRFESMNNMSQNKAGQKQFIDTFKMFIALLEPDIVALKSLPSLDARLGVTIVAAFHSLLNRAVALTRTVDEINPVSVPRMTENTNLIIYEEFRRLFTASSDLIAMLEAIRSAKMD